MKPSSPWTTPDELVAQVQRLWERGELLRTGAQPFPRRLRLRSPSPRELGSRFPEVRQWIADLRGGAEKHGYSVEMEVVDNRVVGRNEIPVRVFVATETDALRMIARHRDAERFRAARALLVASWPALTEWIDQHPLKLLDVADQADAMAAVLRFFIERPRSGLYRRQLEIEGVDTKFIERHRAILTELLERVLAAHTLCTEPEATFDRRFGLREKPSLVRFRILDRGQRLHGLSDLSVPVAELAALDHPAREVIITENEVNALSLPERADTLALFGQGHAMERLREIPWLRERRVLYWGDIDTHGFEILDRLRAFLPHARSMLMDRATLVAHRPLWVTEVKQATWEPKHLTADELRLLRDLQSGVFGASVRLEQERVSFGAVRSALEGEG
jgi:hypothetical protein